MEFSHFWGACWQARTHYVLLLLKNIGKANLAWYGTFNLYFFFTYSLLNVSCRRAFSQFAWIQAAKLIMAFPDRSENGRCWVGITVTVRASTRRPRRTSTCAAVNPGGSMLRRSWPAPSWWSAPSAAGPTSATPWRIPGNHVSARRQVFFFQAPTADPI